MTFAEEAELQDQIARIIDPGAWSFRGLWPNSLGPGPHREVRIKAAEEAAAEENNRAKAVSLAKARQIFVLFAADQNNKA